VDHPLATQDEEGFQQAIRHFIAVHATDEDCHELLDYICSVAKPRKMDVQTYYIRLQELTRQVDWLLGNNLPLTEDQLHQAFFDGMPTRGRSNTRTLVVLCAIHPKPNCLGFFECNKKLLNIANKLTK
jgi:hypothetical protein